MFTSLRPSERLIAAVIENNYDDALQALQDGADVNVQRTKNTPILFALSKKHFEIANLLVEHNANLNVDNGYGWLPIHEICQQGNQEWLSKVMDDPMLYLDRKDRSGETPLVIALANGHDDIAAALVKARCDVNSQTDSGVTPFMLAVERQKIELVELMLEKKGDVNLVDGSGRSALDRAENWAEGKKLLSGLKAEKTVVQENQEDEVVEIKEEENTLSSDGIRGIQKRRRPS